MDGYQMLSTEDVDLSSLVRVPFKPVDESLIEGIIGALTSYGMHDKDSPIIEWCCVFDLQGLSIDYETQC